VKSIEIIRIGEGINDEKEILSDEGIKVSKKS